MPINWKEIKFEKLTEGERAEMNNVRFSSFYSGAGYPLLSSAPVRMTLMEKIRRLIDKGYSDNLTSYLLADQIMTLLKKEGLTKEAEITKFQIGDRVKTRLSGMYKGNIGVIKSIQETQFPNFPILVEFEGDSYPANFCESELKRVDG